MDLSHVATDLRPRLDRVSPCSVESIGGSARSPMPYELLTARDSAQRLGISVTSLYDWLGQSDRGLFVIRGQRVTINYLQGGPRGQGRIRIEVEEVERIKELMRVRPQTVTTRRAPIRHEAYPGITVKLGRPDKPS
jgi:hypothetical protein